MGPRCGQGGSALALGRRKTSSTTLLQETSPSLQVDRGEGGEVGGRGSSCGRRWKGVLEPHVRSAQEGFIREKAGLGHKPSEQAHSRTEIQNGVNETSSTSVEEGSLYRVYRHEGRLLAHTSPQAISEVPGLRCKWSSLRLQSDAIWSQFSTESLHKDYESCGSKTTRLWDCRADVSRRLAHHSKLQGRMRGNGPEDIRNWKSNGTPIQSKEVPSRTDYSFRMARAYLEYPLWNSGTLDGKQAQMSSEAERSKVLFDFLYASMGESHRIIEPCYRGHPLRQDPGKTSDLGRAESFLGSEQRSGSTVPSPPSEAPELVVQEPIRPFHQLDSSTSRADASHGCVGSGLGIPDIRRSPRTRQLVTGVAKIPYQHQGTEGSVPGPGSGDQPEEHGDPRADGQHSDDALHQQTGHIAIIGVAPDDREAFPPGEEARTSFVGVSPARKNEPSIGRTVSAVNLVGGMDTEAGRVRSSCEQVRGPRGGSVRVPIQQETGAIPLPHAKNSSRRSGRTPRQLEPVGVSVSVSSTTDERHAASDLTFEGFHWPSIDGGSAMEGTAVDRGVTQLVPEPVSTRRHGAGRDHRCTIDEITKVTRVEFLRRALTRSLQGEAADDIMAGHRESTTRQYQSSWKKFQEFVRQKNVQEINPGTPLEFASYLFHTRKLSISSILGHMAAIADPLKFAFNVSPDTRAFELMKASFFNQRPPKVKKSLQWSLHKVLAYLSSEKFTENSSTELKLQKAVFLTALASGLRVSQLAALTRLPALTKFAPGDRKVILTAHPSFIAKNERLHHRMKPTVIPALWQGDTHHALCPVAALKAYMQASGSQSEGNLWIWPTSGRPCTPSNLAKVIVAVIEAADPGSAPTAHEVRKYASSLAFLRSLDIEEVQEAGQWASCSTFITNYLNTQLQDTRCVAMGSLPGNL